MTEFAAYVHCADWADEVVRPDADSFAVGCGQQQRTAGLQVEIQVQVQAPGVGSNCHLRGPPAKTQVVKRKLKNWN